MRFTLYAAALAASLTFADAAQAQTAAPAPAAPTTTERYSVADTDVGTLLDNPATKAILVKYLPDLVNSPQIDMARSMTLETMQAYAPDKLTDDILAKVDADLAKVPFKK